jgi:hypothetical protein
MIKSFGSITSASEDAVEQFALGHPCELPRLIKVALKELSPRG